MPKKIQLKLLSSSGELLNVVTCRAGRITVLRGGSPSDLRPYQRALSGTSDGENVVVTCDEQDLNPEQHFTLGFGEASPCTGLSVKEFLAKQRVASESHQALLVSVGLTDIYEKQCSQLSTDQETRLRLIVATTESNKALILNNPFESVGASWRETLAEIIVSFAKNSNALILVPSLSYRPECWIDNDLVDRVQVGHTAQRTIGFGSSDLASTALMADITAKVRGNQGEKSPNNQKTATLAAGAIAANPLNEESTQDIHSSATPKTFSTILKLSSVAIGILAGTWGAFTILEPSPSSNKAIATKLPDASQGNPTSGKQNTSNAVSHRESNPSAKIVASANKPQKTTKASVSTRYILDLYPASIKQGILDTANGVVPTFEEQQSETEPAHTNTKKPQQGSLFSLLENASSKDSSSSSRSPANSYRDDRYDRRDYTDNDDDNDNDEMEARREEIRNRFLEAIRQNALRRQAALDQNQDDY